MQFLINGDTMCPLRPDGTRASTRDASIASKAQGARRDNCLRSREHSGAISQRFSYIIDGGSRRGVAFLEQNEVGASSVR